MKDSKDREIIRLCVRQDRQAWDQFVALYANYIYSIILNGLRVGRYPYTREDAEDIFAEVFLSLVEKDFHLLRSFEWRCSLKTWLWVITRKKVIRHFRKKGIKTIPIPGAESGVEAGRNPSSLISQEMTPPEAADAGEIKTILEETLADLGDRDRLCLALYFFNGHSYKEISKILDVPANHVGILIHRAKKRLEKKLQGRGLSNP